MLFSAVDIEVFLPVKLEVGPYLNTLLGSIGVNTAKFCKDFKIRVKELPIYLKVTTIIHVNVDRTYSFDIKLPNLSFLLNLVSQKRGIIKIIFYSDIIYICLLKFGICNKQVFFSTISTIKSMDLVII